MPTGRPLLSDLRQAVRDNLDEDTAAFWTDAQLNRMLTRSADAVLQEALKVAEDWFSNGINSIDGTRTIFGVTYDTTQLQFTPTNSFIVCPPDLLSIRVVECLTPGYEWVPVTMNRTVADPDFRIARTGTQYQAQEPNHFYLAPILGVNTNSAGPVYVYSPLSSVTLDMRLVYTSSVCIYSTASASKRAFTLDTDELALPHPLYQAVEELATMRASMKDATINAGAWSQMATNTMNRWMATALRQSQDPVYVQDFGP